MSTRPSIGFVVDLDDTLYAQADYLAEASLAVGQRADELGLDGPLVTAALIEVLREGSDRGFSIDEALRRCGAQHDPELVSRLVEAFVRCRPSHLDCYSGVASGLRTLRESGPLACLTDGRPEIQRAKLDALGLRDAFDLVVITDEIGGRRMRKPDPEGLYRIAKEFEIPVTRLVVIGDRPEKDIAMAHACGAHAIRIKQGEYVAQPSLGLELSVSSFREAVQAVLAAIVS